MTRADRLRHMAVNLLPHVSAIVRNTEPDDVRIGDEEGRNVHNFIMIALEVAEALAVDRFGKPRFRVQARSRTANIEVVEIAAEAGR